MDQIQIIFVGLIQDQQQFGSNNDFLDARVFFVVDGVEYISHIRQPAGGESHSFEDLPIEVETPNGLRKKVNYGEFREALEQFYRSQVGPTGSGIRFDSSSKNISMSGNVFVPQPKAIWISRAGFENAW